MLASTANLGAVRISVCEARLDFSTAANGACNVPVDAVGKSVVILRARLDEAISVKDRELHHGHFPVLRCAAPIGGDVAQPRVDAFDGVVV